jgi:prevent-host-death family protein
LNWTAKCELDSKMPTNGSKQSLIVSALHARNNFGRFLRQVEQDSKSVVIEKRGTPKAVLLSIRQYVRLAAPEPEVLRIIGEESRRNGTDKLPSRRIEQIIRKARMRRQARA